MKRASYRQAVQWIACNDNTGSKDDEATIASYISTLLIADIFDVEPDRVARDVMRQRVIYLKSLKAQ